MSGVLGGVTTALFVPGSRPDRFAKAASSAADAVILDLEDAVAPGERASARRNIAAYLADGPRRSTWIRINGADTEDHRLDIELVAELARASSSPAAIVLAKAEAAEDVDRVAAIAGAPVVPLIESVAGYAAARALARAAAPDGRLAFGAIDFALDAGTTAQGPLDAAVFELVVASRLAGMAPPLGSPTPAIRETSEVREAARRTASLGCSGMLCIHPAQLEAVVGAFLPSEEDVEWARRVVDAGSQAVQVDGMMVDAPVVERARRILTQHRSRRS